MFGRRPLSWAISAALGLTAFTTWTVQAQDRDDASGYEPILEEIIVTGTRIVMEDGYGRTSPVTVIGLDEIESFGITRVEDILNTLPQIEAAQTAFWSNGATGTATVNLRGLGAQRNLVLINGRRMQPGGVWTESADINQIPAQMIDRVEVLTGGASAVYGADAVAGVVNFILRRVDGVEFSIGASGYQHDNRNRFIQGLMDEAGFDYPTGSTGIDGKGYDANLVIGGDFADGRGNATVYVNWRSNEALLQAARDYSSCAVNARYLYCGGSMAATEIPNFFIAPLTEDGWGPYGYDYFQEGFATLQPDNSLAVLLQWWTTDWQNLANVYNYAPINFFMRPDERWSAGAFADFEVNEHAVAYLEVMTAHDQSRAQIAESGTFMQEIYPLPLDNAYFPDSFRASLEAYWPGVDQFGIYIGKRNVEGGPRADVTEHGSFRIVAGLKGSLTADWSYDLSLLHAQTQSTSVNVNDLLRSRVRTAVNSDLCEADPGCIPYLVFTYQGVTEEAARSLTGTATLSSSTSTDVFQGYVTGATGWGLPAGNVMLAAGYEHRRVAYSILPDSLSETSELMGWITAVKKLDGAYGVDELFFEADVPLLADHAFARNMTLNLAYRWSDYSTSGGNSTYRAGLDWQISDWLRLRTGYNRAVRAPNVVELFEPQQVGPFGGYDPCAGAEPVYSLEQCARTGVTAAQYGNIYAAPWDEGTGSSNILFGGNPDLQPEQADTVTLGLVVEAGNDIQLSLDYWDIQIEDVIDYLDIHVILDQCALNGRLCELIHRGPDGSLWRTNDDYVVNTAWNVGGWDWAGIDVAWSWAPGDHWRFGLLGSWYLKREITPVAGDASTSYDCTGQADDNYCGTVIPRWRHTAHATWDSGASWSVTGRWRYYHQVSHQGNGEPLIGDAVAAQSFFDLSATVMLWGAHELSLGVNNVLDKEPPLLPGYLTNNANTAAGFYDALGRYVFARATFRW